MVYDRICIQYLSDVNPFYLGSLGDYMACDDQGDEEVVTNLELVAASGYAAMVKKVVIDVNYIVDPMPGFGAVIDRMRTVAEVWEMVQVLEFVSPLDTVPYDDKVKDHCDPWYWSDVGEVSRDLAAMFPAVRELRFDGMKGCPGARLLYGQLAGLYADQLQTLHSAHAIAVPDNQQFTQLKDVAISAEGNADYLIPRMCAASIERLRLDGFHPHRSWAPLSTDENSQAIELPALQRLDVTYGVFHATGSDDEEHAAGDPWVLQLPNLRELAVSCVGAVCPLLEHAVLPHRLDSVTLSVSPRVLQSITALPRVTYGIRVIYDHHGADQTLSAMAIASNLLEMAGECPMKELDVRCHDLPVLPKDLSCTDLTRLVVSAPTSVDTMLSIIHRLPNLVHLMFHNLTLEDIQSDISIPGCEMHEPVSPLDTKIRRLHLDFSNEIYRPEFTGPVAKYLLLKILTLVELFADHVPEYPVQDLIDTYAQWYPHLERVKLDFP